VERRAERFEAERVRSVEGGALLWADFMEADLPSARFWLNRLQTRDYTFVTHGNARTLSGIQALLSFYLVAVWLLMLFRNPFQ